MNTPPTIKRNHRRTKGLGPAEFSLPGGLYSSGIGTTEVQVAYASAISFWPMVEDSMTKVLQDLLGSPKIEIASEIFHALLAQNTRLPVMRALLQNTTGNADKSAEYDAILDEFKRLNDERNLLVHGYWYTHAETGDVYLCKSNQSAAAALAGGKKVTAGDLSEFERSCFSLLGRAYIVPSSDSAAANTRAVT